MPKISALPPMTTPDGDDPSPVVDDSAGATKKLTLTQLKEWLQSLAGWITTAMHADDSVTDEKLDYPRFWKEIARSTLTVAGNTINVPTIPSMKYLKILVDVRATGGTINGLLQLNGDNTNQYGYRVSSNGGADATSTSFNAIPLVDSGTSAADRYAVIEILNIPTKRKIAQGGTVETSAAGTVTRRIGVAVWNNTSDAISSIQLTSSGTGNYAIGSEVVVLGHN